MSQNALSIANVAGASYRAGVNSALDTLLNLNSGAAAPAATQAGMFWYDTTNGVVKQRNAANSGWIQRWTVASAEGVFTGNVTVGGTLNVTGDITISRAAVGASIQYILSNTDNTNALSNAYVTIATGGAGGGDPVQYFNIGGAANTVIGLDNSDSDKFKISVNSTALGAGDALTITQAGAVTIPISLSVSAGVGAATLQPAGLISAQTSAAGIGNGADATDDTLFTYSLPLNSLSANGKTVRVKAYGTHAANNNSKTLKLWFAGATVMSTVSTSNNQPFFIDVQLTRIDATHISVLAVTFIQGVAIVPAVAANLVIADLAANASIIKVTGLSGSSAANDMLGYGMSVEFMN